MKVFLLLIHKQSNSFLPESSIWYKNLYEPLIDIGIDTDLFIIEEEKKKLNSSSIDNLLYERVVDSNNNKKIDLFLSYIRNDDIDISTLNQIKSLGFPLANFSCNNTHQFYLTDKIANIFDYNLHSEKDADSKFKAIKANPIWFPMAANPKYYYPINSIKNKDVSFIGMRYSKRAYYLNCLLENEIDVSIFGPNWTFHKKDLFNSELKRALGHIISLFTFNYNKRIKITSKLNDFDKSVRFYKAWIDKINDPLSDIEMLKVFNSSKLNLGFLEVYGSDNDSSQMLKRHLHLREFEVPMSGNLYMTSFSDELCEFYIPEKEIITFSNEFELVDKASYYLKNSTISDRIAKLGYERAIKCHTYQQRYKDLFLKLGLL